MPYPDVVVNISDQFFFWELENLFEPKRILLILFVRQNE